MRSKLRLSSAIAVVLLALTFAVAPVSSAKKTTASNDASVSAVAKNKKHRKKAGKKKHRKHKHKAVKKNKRSGKKLLGRNRRSRQAIHHALNDKHPTTQPSSKKKQ